MHCGIELSTECLKQDLEEQRIQLEREAAKSQYAWSMIVVMLDKHLACSMLQLIKFQDAFRR